MIDEAAGRRPPGAIPAQWPRTAAERWAAAVHKDAAPCGAIALVGLPDDLGVRLNGGREGAGGGPGAFRAALAAFGADCDGPRAARLGVDVFDAGDIPPAPGDSVAALAATHARVEAALHFLHDRHAAVVAIGGGHDLTLPAVRALAGVAGRGLAGINFDAHLDVSERTGSGMAFRRLIEEGSLAGARFMEMGLGRFANQQRHLEWAAAHRVRAVFGSDIAAAAPDPGLTLAALGAGAPAAFVSIDLDALDASVAPGVSAPNPSGLPVAAAASLAEAAGADARVRHFDLMELNPRHDAAGAPTARIAAFLFLSFLAGLGRRESAVRQLEPTRSTPRGGAPER